MNKSATDKKAERQRLARELAAAKKSLREASANVERIEKRMKCLPDTSAQKKRAYPQPTITPQEALAMFDDLVTTYRQKGPAQTKKQLQEWLEKTNSSDRAIVARELHFMSPARPSKQAMFKILARRVTRRIIITQYTHGTFRPEQWAKIKSA